MNRSEFKKAVVIGGSISGLLSARILADYFESVVIFEANALSNKPEDRRGVPQSSQPHILFAKGYQILLELFPGLEVEVLKKGALPIDWAREFHLYHRGWNAVQKNPSEVNSITCSRTLLEFIIRKRVLDIANVSLHDEHKVLGLLQDERNQKITGVSLYSASDKTNYQVKADLVLEACGRSSNLPKLLAELGYKQPPETVVNPKLGYATRRYKIPNGDIIDWKVMLISQTAPDSNRLGYLSKIENDEWIATVGGYGADYPKNTTDNFLEFAKSLPSEKFYNTIIQAEPTSKIVLYRSTANRLRHYEKIPMPEGLICIGDAVCALCPIYGQGLTVSALSSIVLRKWIKSKFLNRSNFDSSSFQRELMKSNLPHWNLAISQDAKFKTTEGREYVKNNWILKLVDKFAQSILRKAQVDSKINLIFIKVSQLIATPLNFFQPYIIYTLIRNK